MKRINNSLRPIFAALLWGLSFMVSVFSLKNFGLPPSAGIGLIILNGLLFVIYIFASLKSFREMDEVQVRIHLEAVVIAFALSLLLFMTLGLADLFLPINKEKFTYLHIFPLLFFFYFFGLFISRSKYR